MRASFGLPGQPPLHSAVSEAFRIGPNTDEVSLRILPEQKQIDMDTDIVDIQCLFGDLSKHWMTIVSLIPIQLSTGASAGREVHVGAGGG